VLAVYGRGDSKPTHWYGRCTILATARQPARLSADVSQRCWRKHAEADHTTEEEEAVQIGQVLAQYVRAAPASALKATLNMMSKAFDDFMISKEDWDAIEQEVLAMAQSQQGGAPGQGGGPSSPPQQGAPQAGGGMQVAATVVQALSQLPPPVLQAIGQALSQGVPPAEIFKQMLASQGGGGAPQQGAAA